MKMKEINCHKLLSTVLSLVVSVSLSAQMGVGIGQWRTHFSYNATTHIAVTNDKVFALSSGSLYSVDKLDNLIETYSKITGLSDNNIHHISYIAEKKILVIGYKNGNIDLMYENGDIVNIPDVYNKNITVDKVINDCLYFDKYLYLAMPLGIIKVDIDAYEINDTYYFRNNNGIYINTLSIEAIGDSFFVATKDKIYKAPVKGVNLANLANWDTITNKPIGDNKKILNHQSKLYLLQSSGKVSIYSNNTWTEGLYSNIIDIYPSNDHLIMIKEKSILYDRKIDFDFQPQMAEYDPKSKKIWVASYEKGILGISVSDLSDQIYYKPDGPIVNDIWRIKIIGNKVFIVPGGRWDTPNNKGGSLTIYENNVWNNLSTSYLEFRFQSLVRDFIDITIDPKDNNHFFIASWGTGLFEFRQNMPHKRYRADNTGTLYDYRIGNVCFDKKRRLWLSNPETPSFIKYADNNINNEQYDIYPLPITSSSDVWTPSDLLVDSQKENIKYLVVARGNTKFVAVNDNGTLNNSSDDEIFSTSQFIDQDGKIFAPNHLMCGVQDPITGSLWIGSTSGPFIMPTPHNVFKPNYRCQRIKIPRSNNNGVDYLLGNETVLDIAIDGNNNKWIATQNSGVYLMNEDGTETILHFTTANSPLLSDFVRTIAVNNITGEVYFGTNNGLISYQGEAVEASRSFDSIHAFPNPVRPDYHGDVAIKGLAENSVVKITDAAGNLVFETFARGGMAVWNAKGIDGKRVASGVYLAICNTKDNSKHGVVKILVIN